MPKFDKAWHEADMADELAEYEEETKLLKKWSEASDVVYTYTRAKWSGLDLSFPLMPYQYLLGLLYMLPKYSSRFLFFRGAGRKAGADKDIRCVRNPKKLHKLDDVVDEQNIEVSLDTLKAICKRRRKYWPLLP